MFNIINILLLEINTILQTKKMDYDPNNDFSEICQSLTEKINQVSSMKLSTDENQAEALEKLRVQVR